MKRAVQIVIGIAVAALLMWVLLRGVSWQDLRGSLQKIHWGWLILAQIPIWASFSRIQRWVYVVRAVHPATFRAMFNSTQLAFLVNFTIGMRLGEIVRPLALSLLFADELRKGDGRKRARSGKRLRQPNCLVILIGVVAFRPDHDIQLPAGHLWTDRNAHHLEVSSFEGR